MVIKIPFDEDKTDVQLSFERSYKSLSEEEIRSLNILADFFTSCPVKFEGKNNHEYISIEKVEDGLIVKYDTASIEVLDSGTGEK